MGQLVSPKEHHERLAKRGKPFIKSQQRRFVRKSIAEQHGDKIDEIVMAKAGAGKAHPILDRFQNPLMSEDLSKSNHSPIQEGVVGFDSGAIWMVTEKRVILPVCPPCLRIDLLISSLKKASLAG
jgi:hypothetical protein